MRDADHESLIERTLPLEQPHANGFRRSWLLVILLGLLGFYLFMFLRYRPSDIDNPWFLSFSYNACVEHVSTDEFMQVRYPTGMDGTQYFGRIAAFVQCAVLNRTGWHQWPAEILTSVLIVASLGLWSLKLRRLGYGHLFIASFLVWTGLSEPLVAAANRFRYESVSFFLLSLGLLLVARGYLYWGALVGSLAIEVEPIALAGLIPLVVLAYEMRKIGVREGLRLGAGTAVGGMIYLSLHPDVIHRAGHSMRLVHGGGGEWGGFVATYLEQRSRHLPELIVFAVAAILYLRQRSPFRSHYSAITAALILLFSFMISHGNPAYMIFLYPFLVVMALDAFRVEMRWKPILIILLVYFLSQYAVLAYVNRDQGYRSADIRNVSDMIRSIASERRVDDEALHIYGDYGLWFAHPRNYVAASVSTLSQIRGADLYLCFNHSAQIPALQPRLMLFCPNIQQQLELYPLRSVDVRGNTLYFYVRRDGNTTDKILETNPNPWGAKGLK